MGQIGVIAFLGLLASGFGFFPFFAAQRIRIYLPKLPNALVGLLSIIAIPAVFALLLVGLFLYSAIGRDPANPHGGWAVLAAIAFAAAIGSIPFGVGAAIVWSRSNAQARQEKQ